MIRAGILALGLLLGACSRGPAGDDAASEVAVGVSVRFAPVADDHPWVIAWLTSLALAPPPGIEARLDGRTELAGQRVAEPVFAAATREPLREALAAYEREHPRPLELAPVWEQIDPEDPSGSPTWRLHFVELGEDAGDFVVDGEARARLRDEPHGTVVELRLGAGQREQLASLTRVSVGHRLVIAIGDGGEWEAVAVPVVREPIAGGQVQLWLGRGSAREAATRALLDRLRGA